MSLIASIKAALRRRVIARHPVDDGAWEACLAGRPLFVCLDARERLRLRELAALFLGYKRFVPLGRAKVDPGFELAVAAQACLPLIELDIDWYRDFSTIYVTETDYRVLQSRTDDSGVVTEYEDDFAGEAFDLGPVALSRADVEESGFGTGYNVVIHEMAHKLDGRDGVYDGRPPLRPGMDGTAWKAAFTAAYGDARRRSSLPKGRHRRARERGPLLDEYAAESPDEFFAVACEWFFERPRALRSAYPEVYGQLALFFGRDALAGAGQASRTE